MDYGAIIEDALRRVENLNKISYETLKKIQSLSLDDKICISQQRIREWYEAWDGDVSVSFSGGWDSSLLLHIVRKLYPDVPAVFVNTGLEYPEIVDFVRKTDNVVWLRPKLPFHKIVEKYGYPVISKENSQKIYDIRNTKSKKLLYKRLHGNGTKWKSGKLPDKWMFMLDAPFKISEKCCYHLKKAPAKKMNNPFLGLMTCDSKLREQKYLRNGGCNSFKKNIQSTPLAFWTRKDTIEYVERYDLSYSTIYDMGYSHTGCMFCMFGVHLEKGLNRFQRMRKTHPKQWEYCINKLGCGEVLDYMGIEYGL